MVGRRKYFLVVQSLSEQHFDCILHNAEGNFKHLVHTCTSRYWNVYTAEMNETIDDAIKIIMHLRHSKYNKMIKIFGT